MPVVSIDKIADFSGQTVTLQGWLYNHRSSGKIAFLQIRDGSVGTIQAVVVKGEASDDAFALCSELTQESALRVTGEVREHRGKYELGVSDIELVHKAEQDYPISKKEHGPEFLMNQRHLWLRTPTQTAIMRVRAKVIRAIRNYFDSRDYICMDAPILTGNSCEGTSTLFKTDYFGEDAFLSQTGQLYGEVGAMACGKVYVFGPTFRAEKSKTRKHLTEFWMLEPEIAFCDIKQNAAIAEDFVRELLKDVLQTCSKELAFLERDTAELENITKTDFPRITYAEAIELLNKHGHDMKWGDDFGAPEETKLGELHDGKPVFILEFPKELKSFYFKENPDDTRTVFGMDLIAPNGYGEIIGGGERETDYEKLLAGIKAHNLDEKEYHWYLDLRRYGSVPHAGFGLGLERTVAWICGTSHIRETIGFPRTLNYLRP